jgi:hypothetical protein
MNMVVLPLYGAFAKTPGRDAANGQERPRRDNYDEWLRTPTPRNSDEMIVSAAVRLK